MPPLSSIALRYLAWLVGLRALYAFAVIFAGLPQAMASDVILAAAPVMVIATFVTRGATRQLVFADWATVWGVCLGIFTVLMIAVPLAITTNAGGNILAPALLRQTLMALLATAVMMALFTLIGARMRS